MSALVILAVNEDLGELRHTNLTRLRGEAPDLPALAEWLGTEVDTSAIELFPVRDVASMGLSAYLREAFSVSEAELSEISPALAQLDGHVLLIPESALTGTLSLGPELSLIGAPAVDAVDHVARDLPKADVGPQSPPPTKPPMSQARVSGMVALAALLFLGVFVFFLVLFSG